MNSQKESEINQINQGDAQQTTKGKTDKKTQQNKKETNKNVDDVKYQFINLIF